MDANGKPKDCEPLNYGQPVTTSSYLHHLHHFNNKDEKNDISNNIHSTDKQINHSVNQSDKGLLTCPERAGGPLYWPEGKKARKIHIGQAV